MSIMSSFRRGMSNYSFSVEMRQQKQRKEFQIRSRIRNIIEAIKYDGAMAARIHYSEFKYVTDKMFTGDPRINSYFRDSVEFLLVHLRSI